MEPLLTKTSLSLMTRPGRGTHTASVGKALLLPGPPAKPVFADDSGNEVDDEVDDEDGRALSRAL